VSERSLKYQLLPHCSKHAPQLIIVAACDGASSVGQIGNEVARLLTRRFPDKVRMCCLSAVAAGSEVHLKIFREARAVVAINGCQLKCASRVLLKQGIKPTYEVVVAELGSEKLPTLDYDYEKVEEIASKIVREFIERFEKSTG